MPRRRDAELRTTAPTLMESTRERAVTDGVDTRSQAIFNRLRTSPRLTATAAGVVVASILGGWLYTRAQAGKEYRAEQALTQARVALQSQNAALAQADLERLVSTYRGTGAGTQGALALAEVHYAKGEYQKGIDVLSQTKPAEQFAAPVAAMLGDGYSQLGKPREAAQEYRLAAEATPFKEERESHLADAARALTVAGDTAAAVQIWQELAANPSGAFAAEARVRIGELTAKPTSRG